jgi:hypothetical protein
MHGCGPRFQTLGVRGDGATPARTLDATTPARLQAAREILERLEGESACKRRDQEAAKAAEWERRAVTAVNAQSDDLAIDALRRKRERDRLHRSFEREHQSSVRLVAALRDCDVAALDSGDQPAMSRSTSAT